MDSKIKLVQHHLTSIYNMKVCMRFNLTDGVRLLGRSATGLSYGFDREGVANKVDRIYKEELFPVVEGKDLAAFVDRLAEMPLAPRLLQTRARA